jgi:hypothetical protein
MIQSQMLSAIPRLSFDWGTFLNDVSSHWFLKILTVWKRKFWQFGKENFDSLKIEILTVWKGKFWQFGKENFDSLKRKFWQFENWNFGRFRDTVKSHHNFRTAPPYYLIYFYLISLMFAHFFLDLSILFTIMFLVVKIRVKFGDLRPFVGTFNFLFFQ